MTGSRAGWPDAAALDAALRAHHAGDDAVALCVLHQQAAALTPNRAERRFHLTHAWVYALVAGNEEDIARLEMELRALEGL